MRSVTEAMARLAPLVVAVLVALASAAAGVERKRPPVLVTEADDARAGREAAEEVAAEIGILPDEDLESYVQRIGRKLLRGIPRRGFDYQFQVVDETEVRTLAYGALGRTAAPRFAEARELRYREPVRYDSFASFVEGIVGVTYCGFPRERVDTAEVRALFEAGRSDDGYVFTQHVRVNLYRTPSRHGS